MEGTDFSKQVSWGFAGRVLGAVVALVGSIYIANEVGESTYGLFYFMMAVASVTDNPISGWAQGCRKRFTEEDWDDSAAVGSIYLAVVVGSGVLLAVLLPVQIFVGEVKGFEPLVFWVLFTGIISYNVTLTLVDGTSSFGMSPWIGAIRDIFRVGLQIVFIWIFADLFGMVLGIVLINLLIVPAVLWWIGVRPSFPTKRQLRSIWSYARSSIPGSFIGTIMTRTDVLMIGLLSTSLFVGNYRVGMNLTMPAMFVGGVISAGMMSQVSNMSSRNVNVGPQIQRGAAYASILAIPIGVGCVIMGEQIAVAIYSEQYREAGLFIAALGIYRVFQTQYQVVSSSIEGLDRPDLALRIDALGLGTNVCLGLILFYVTGPAGIAWATVVSVVARYFVGNRTLSDLVDVNLSPDTLRHQILSGLVMGVVVFLANQETGDGIVSTIFVIGIGGVVYFSSLFTLSEDFRQLTRNNISYII